MTNSEKAIELRKKGFNCAQSVALAFCDELGLDPVLVSKSLEGFGAGMGGYELTCGALSAAVYLAGIKFADGSLDSPCSKQTTYSVCKELVSMFKTEIGSTACEKIKGISDGKALKSCDDCILCGVKLAENMLKEK